MELLNHHSDDTTKLLSNSVSQWEDLALTKTLFEKDVLLCPFDSANDATFCEIMHLELQQIQRNKQDRSFLAKLGLSSSKLLEQNGIQERKCSSVSDSSDSFVDLGIEMYRKDEVVIQKPCSFVIDQQYMNSSTAGGEWQTLFDQQKKYDFDIQTDKPLIFRQIQEDVKGRRLNAGQSRALAWLLLLNITKEQVMDSLYEDYLKDANDLNKSSQQDLVIQRQISVDIPRTFSDQQFPELRVPCTSGLNPLYNVLVAYSKHLPEVGYCQGMNYLCALILIGVDFDENTAFTILDRLMVGQGYNLSGFYTQSLQSLYEMSDYIYSWLLSPENSDLEAQFRIQGVPLTTLLAGPFMALFANILDVKTCLSVLDLVILMKREVLLLIVKNVLTEQRQELLNISQGLHPYMIRKVYLDAIANDKFFPKFQ